MEKKSHIAFGALLLFSLFLIFSRTGRADNPGLSEEARSCLTCHSGRGLRVTFANKESIEAHVDPGRFMNSVHGFLSCRECHAGFSKEEHPKRTFHSIKQYREKASLACRRCHPDRQIRESSVHGPLFKKERAGSPILCTNCHGSHSVRPAGKSTNYPNEEAYCMKCHGFDKTMSFRNGEALRITVDPAKLRKSVHNMLACSDCHYGFSSEEHPRRNFSTRRDYTLASSDNCRRCHFDKYTKTMESIHYTMLSQGNTSAPVCIDCHGSHNISRAGNDRSSITGRCARCHLKTYDTYAKSVHGSALFSENNQDVPVCTDCHTAHTIENPRLANYRERIPEICSNCHANKAIVGKYGLSTNVVESYLSDFHGVTLEFYRLQKKILNKPGKPMAVCTDCHGSHDITTTTGGSEASVRENLQKTCQKCHPGATQNFPDTWLSHYEPAFARAPLVFIIDRAYGIFIPILVSGLALQILLHIWRYVVNR